MNERMNEWIVSKEKKRNTERGSMFMSMRLCMYAYVCMYVCVDIVERKVRYPSTLQATKA